KAEDTFPVRPDHDVLELARCRTARRFHGERQEIVRAGAEGPDIEAVRHAAATGAGPEAGRILRQGMGRAAQPDRDVPVLVVSRRDVEHAIPVPVTGHDAYRAVRFLM